MGQTSVSSLSEQASVDGLDKASIANSDGPTPGSQTPPFKRKGKLSTIGKIFKPWKWRKKKASDKFKETSAVLERKISTRQSREELIRKGVLKEMPEQDGDVTVNFETSNGHTITISEETIQEENVIKTTENNGSVLAKAPAAEGKKEDKESTVNCPEKPASHAPPPPKSKPKPKKASIPPKNVTAAATSHKNNEAPHVKKKVKAPAKQPPVPPPKPAGHNANREAASSSHAKKLPVSKSSSSPSPSSTSSHPKASKETTSSKTGTSGTSRGKKKPGKQSAPRTRADGDVSSTSSAAPDNLETKVENSQPEQPPFIISESEDAEQQSKSVIPPPPTVPPPPPPPLPSSPSASQSTDASKTPSAPISTETGLSVPGSDSNPLLQTEHEADNENLSSEVLDNSLDRSEENTTCSVTKEDPEEETPNLTSPQPTEEPLEPIASPEHESSKESHTSDSDSDGPILYTDDDDDDDDDNTSAESALASKIRRRDTLAIKLGNRPSKKELEDKNILQRTSEEERQEIRHQIGTKLVRRLSQRPTTEELEQRNILKQKNEEEEQEARRELKRRLSRKLSLRPTVAELQARRILRFNEYVGVTESPDYDRRADKPWARLTPADKAAIRKELNEFKSTEMEVHEESRQFTRFHRP
uniref:Phosphatase and actin regulator n=1 Tax=Pelodiscus sinensis TaxID=13735 RepID=K7G9D9_PELSI|nr:phosphatase and actin regulator 2 isoform X1 [Pelodiscus sinensis]|eukprot:XP_006139391.1 phosphatase and actin regulator 2 isoform X1 [Pelodiscus sinensis]